MKKIFSYLVYKIFVFISFFLLLFPRKLKLFIGRNLGVIFYLVSLRKKVAEINLKIAFKNKDDFEIEKILISCYRHFGMVFIDFLTQQFLNKNNISDYIVFHKKDLKLLQSSSGGVVMSAHLGNWETVLPALGLNNIMMETVIRKQRNDSANNLYLKARSFPNIGLIWEKGSIKKLYNAISEKKYIGLASDQSARSGGVRIDFFSKDATFPKGSGKFHFKTNCKVFIVFSILGSDYKYHIYVKEIQSTKTTEENIINDITTQYVKILENKIKCNPSQYFWFHKKWDKRIYK